MSQLTSAILTQIAFKRLSGKAMSSGKLSLSEEELGSTVQSSATTILGQVVPNAPALTDYLIQSASDGGPGTVQRVVFDLLAVEGTEYLNTSGTEVQAISGVTANTISPRQGFDAALGDVVNNVTDTYHAYTLKLPDNYQTVGGTDVGFATHASTPKSLGDAPFINSFNSTGSVQMQVVPEYLSTVIGSTNAYIPKLFATNGDAISAGSTIDWYFDAMAGVLFVADPPVDNTNPESPPSNANQPGTLKAFLYVGQYQSEVVSGETVDLHFSASAGTGFSFGNTATASFTTSSGEGLTITAGTTNNIEFELVNVISGSEQIADLGGFHISGSGGAFDVAFNQSASFESGSAGVTVVASTNKKITIGANTDNVHFNEITGSSLKILGTASIAYFETLYTTSSVIYSSGSTKFGDDVLDFHEFTGSLELSSSGLDGFTWDTPQGSNITIPLVYDVDNKRVLTGSDYFKKNEFGIHLSASEGTGFSLTNLSTASFTTSSNSGEGLTITAGTTNNIEFELVGVISSSEQILDGTGILSSSTQNFVTYSSSINTQIAAATASIASATASIADLVVSQSEGFLLRGGTGTAIPVNGGNVLPFGTASFVGTNGISIVPAGAASTQLNVTFAENQAPSTIAISASNGITSIAYGGTASFTSSGAGLSVGQTAGTVTYTITPDDVLNGATDTATFNFTSSVAVSSSYALSSSYAVTASYVSGTIDGGASTVQVTEDTSTNNRLGVVFSNLAADDLDTDGEINEDVILKGKNGIAFAPGRNTLFVGDASTTTYLAENPTGIGVGANSTFNFLTDGNSMFADSTTVAPLTLNVGGAAGTVFFKGSASIDGDLIVKGSTTSINTTNLNVEDQFILLASRSAAANLDGGIIVQTGEDGDSTAIGTALFYDDSESRWGLTKADDTAFDATSATPRQYVVSVSSSNSEPPTVPTDFGNNAVSRYGMMYVDTSDSAGDGNTIWIYAE